MYFTLAPLMHAAAQWTSFMWFFVGGRVILLDGPLDPEKVRAQIDNLLDQIQQV